MLSRAIGNTLFVSRVNGTYRRRKISDKDLLPSHQLMISFICRHPGSSQDSMVTNLGMDKTTITHRIAGLEKLGYIYRKISPDDARVRLVYPTEKAKELYPEIHDTYESFTDRILEGFTEEEIDELTRLTEKMRQNANKLMSEMGKEMRKDAKKRGEGEKE